MQVGKINERNMFAYPRSVVSGRKLKRLLLCRGCIHEPHNSNIAHHLLKLREKKLAHHDYL